MGTLKLPVGGSIYLDASCIIYSVEKVSPYYQYLMPVWTAAATGSIQIVTSLLTLLETLVRPIRDNKLELQHSYRAILTGANNTQLSPISREVIELATQLRAANGLGVPDAIHAATAIDMRSDLFITNDLGFRRLTDLKVLILSDLASAGISLPDAN